MELFRPDELEEIPGRGIKATVDGNTILCGNAMLLKDHGVKLQEVEEFGTVVYVAVEGGFVGYLVIADTLKDGAKDAVRRLKHAGIATVMLTGDSRAVAEQVAARLHIDGVYSELLPGDKVEKVEEVAVVETPVETAPAKKPAAKKPCAKKAAKASGFVIYQVSDELPVHLL